MKLCFAVAALLLVVGERRRGGLLVVQAQEPSVSQVPSKSNAPSLSPSLFPSESIAPSSAPSLSVFPSLVPSVSSQPSQQPSASPSESQQPSPGDGNDEPSVSSEPSTVPSLSSVPSLMPSKQGVPSVSQLPSESIMPSTQPSVSSAPSISSAPSLSMVPTKDGGGGPTPAPTPTTATPAPTPTTATPAPTPTTTTPAPTPTTAPTPSPTPAGATPAPTPAPTGPSVSPTPLPTPAPTVPGQPPQQSSPTPLPTRAPITPIPFVLPVTDCSPTEPCERCEGHCINDSECEGDLICWKKGYIASKIPFCLGTDWSLTDWCVIKPNDNDPIPYVLPVRDCSTSNKCERCEGHCQSDDECEGNLICTQKEGRGANIPNCLGPHGNDQSLTEWCVNPEDIEPTPAPVPSPPTASTDFVLPVRECSTGNKCVKCEGHCSSDAECQDGLICHDKGYRGSPIPGCDSMIDWSWTEWCIEPPGPDTEIPFVLPVRECTTDNKCSRCAGHCENDNECEGNLVCSQKSGPGAKIPGCSGPQDDSDTEWCINP